MNLTYNDCGVSIERNDTWVSQLKQLGITTGDFASTWEEGNDLWVSSTDGIGSKLILSQECQFPKHLYHLGQDLVAMVVNDIITTGAKPLFLLDYLAVHQIGQLDLSELLLGIYDACKKVGCRLLGGETSELPDIIPSRLFDIAGFGVGKISKNESWGSHKVLPGDVVLGLGSSGPHSNGFSLLRKIDQQNPFTGNTLHFLLEPTTLYVEVIDLLKNEGLFQYVHSAANITGGGLVNNLLRSIPSDLQLELNSISLPPLFATIQQKGNLTDTVLRETFNCGIGFCLIVDREYVEAIKELLEPIFKTIQIGIIRGKTNEYKIIY